MSNNRPRSFNATLSGLLLLAFSFGTTADAQDIGLELTNTDATTDGWVRIADDDTLEPQTLTLEAWIKPKGSGFGGEPMILGKPWEGAAGNWLVSYGIFWVPTDGTLWGVIVHSIGASGLLLVSTGVAPLDEWTHVALTFDGSWLRFYVNGEFDSELAAASPTIDYGTQDVLIGAANFGANFPRRFQGVVDEVRIWDHARSAETIRRQKDCILGGDETGLRAYYSFDSSDATDGSPNGNDGFAEGAVAFVSGPTRCFFSDGFESGDLSAWSSTATRSEEP